MLSFLWGREGWLRSVIVSLLCPVWLLAFLKVFFCLRCCWKWRKILICFVSWRNSLTQNLKIFSEKQPISQRNFMEKYRYFLEKTWSFIGKILKFQGEIQVFLGENEGFPGEIFHYFFQKKRQLIMEKNHCTVRLRKKYIITRIIIKDFITLHIWKKQLQTNRNSGPRGRIVKTANL